MHPNVEKGWKSVQGKINNNFRTMGHLGDRAEKAGMRVGPLTITVIIYFLKKKKDLKQKGQNVHINYIFGGWGHR